MTRFSLKVVALLGVAGVALLTACSKTQTQSTFGPVGDVASKQLDLLWIVIGGAIFVLVTVQGALIYTLIRFRRKPEHGNAIPEQTHGNTRLEIAWTVAPAIVLAIIAVPTVMTLVDLAEEPPADALHILAVGHQWWWEFQYPGQDLTASNELHIPVGRPVSITLESADVIHSFWIPKIAGKVDMVPNHTNRLPTFTVPAGYEGTYLGQCAELCGTAHALMRFRVIAQSPADFEAWVAAQQAPPVESTAEQALAGMEVFRGAGACTLCHIVDGTNLELEETTPRVRKGPNLTHYASRATLAAGMLENTPHNLTRWLQDPNELKPDNLMSAEAPVYVTPTLALDDSQIAALVAYLQSLK